MMTGTNLLVTLMASNGDWGHHGGLWWLFGPLMLLLFVAFFAAVVWFIVRSVRPREVPAVDRARDILAERYARGELTSDEYRERLDHLR